MIFKKSGYLEMVDLDLFQKSLDGPRYRGRMIYMKDYIQFFCDKASKTLSKTFERYCNFNFTRLQNNMKHTKLVKD